MTCRCHPNARCGRCDDAELAGSIADRNDRCGAIQDDTICLKPKQHSGDHGKEPLTTTIPFA